MEAIETGILQLLPQQETGGGGCLAMFEEVRSNRQHLRVWRGETEVSLSELDQVYNAIYDKPTISHKIPGWNPVLKGEAKLWGELSLLILDLWKRRYKRLRKKAFGKRKMSKILERLPESLVDKARNDGTQSREGLAQLLTQVHNVLQEAPATQVAAINVKEELEENVITSLFNGNAQDQKSSKPVSLKKVLKLYPWRLFHFVSQGYFALASSPRKKRVKKAKGKGQKKKVASSSTSTSSPSCSSSPSSSSSSSSLHPPVEESEHVIDLAEAPPSPTSPLEEASHSMQVQLEPEPAPIQPAPAPSPLSAVTSTSLVLYQHQHQHQPKTEKLQPHSAPTSKADPQKKLEQEEDDEIYLAPHEPYSASGRTFKVPPDCPIEPPFSVITQLWDGAQYAPSMPSPCDLLVRTPTGHTRYRVHMALLSRFSQRLGDFQKILQPLWNELGGEEGEKLLQEVVLCYPDEWVHRFIERCYFPTRYLPWDSECAAVEDWSYRFDFVLELGNSEELKELEYRVVKELKWWLSSLRERDFLEDFHNLLETAKRWQFLLAHPKLETSEVGLSLLYTLRGIQRALETPTWPDRDPRRVELEQFAISEDSRPFDPLHKNNEAASRWKVFWKEELNPVIKQKLEQALDEGDPQKVEVLAQFPDRKVEVLNGSRYEKRHLDDLVEGLSFPVSLSHECVKSRRICWWPSYVLEQQRRDRLEGAFEERLMKKEQEEKAKAEAKPRDKRKKRKLAQEHGSNPYPEANQNSREYSSRNSSRNSFSNPYPEESFGDERRFKRRY